MSLASRVLSVKDYVAKGDVSHDDTAAFYAAMAAATNEQEIWIPAGTYILDKIEITKAGLTFSGVGSATSILKLKNNATCTLLRISAHNITIRDLQVDANSTNQTTVRNCIFAWTAPYTRVLNCYLRNSWGNGSKPALTFDGGSDYSIAQGCTFDHVDQAVVVQASSYCQILDNVATDTNISEAYAVYQPDGDPINHTHDNYIARNTVTNSTGPAFVAENANTNIFENNTAINCKGGFYAYGRGVYGLTHDNIFRKNTAIGGPLSDEYGLYAGNDAYNNQFLGNHVTDWTHAHTTLYNT